MSKRKHFDRHEDFVIKSYTRRRLASATPQDLLRINTLLMNRWEVYAKLGRGAHGEVYIAYDRHLGVDVAIKVFKENPNIEDEINIIRKFSNEERFAKYIYHNQKYDHPFVIMDLKGPTLKEIVEQYSPLCLCTVLKVSLQILEAIETMHKNGYLHNDIKLSNVVVGIPPDEANEVFLVDFSLARRFDTYAFSRLKNRNPIPKPGVFSRSRCRRQDLYKLLHLMIELKTDVPWANAKARKDFMAVQEIKEKTTGKLLEQHFGTEFVNFKSHLDSLRVVDTPDYDSLKLCINNFLEHNCVDTRAKMEWEVNPHKIWKVTYVNNYPHHQHKYALFPNRSLSLLPKNKHHDNQTSKSIERTKPEDETVDKNLLGTDKHSTQVLGINSKTSIENLNVYMVPLLITPSIMHKITPSKAKLLPQRPDIDQMDIINLEKRNSYPVITDKKERNKLLTPSEPSNVIDKQTNSLGKTEKRNQNMEELKMIAEKYASPLNLIPNSSRATLAGSKGTRNNTRSLPSDIATRQSNISVAGSSGIKKTARESQDSKTTSTKLTSLVLHSPTYGPSGIKETRRGSKGVKDSLKKASPSNTAVAGPSGIRNTRRESKDVKTTPPNVGTPVSHAPTSGSPEIKKIKRESKDDGVLPSNVATSPARTALAGPSNLRETRRESQVSKVSTSRDPVNKKNDRNKGKKT